jgi:hypothetical protein
VYLPSAGKAPLLFAFFILTLITHRGPTLQKKVAALLTQFRGSELECSAALRCPVVMDPHISKSFGGKTAAAAPGLRPSPSSNTAGNA